MHHKRFRKGSLDICHKPKKRHEKDSESDEMVGSSQTEALSSNDDSLCDNLGYDCIESSSTTKLGLNKTLMMLCVRRILGLEKGEAISPEVPPLAYAKKDINEVQPFLNQILYCEKYCDDVYEYRHVALPKKLLPYVPKHLTGHLLTEWQWRSLGIVMSPGWEHYLLHKPEPHIFLFKREQNYAENYGNLSADDFKKARRLHNYLLAPEVEPNPSYSDESCFPITSITYETVQEWVEEPLEQIRQFKSDSQISNKSTSLRYMKEQDSANSLDLTDKLLL